MSKMEKAFNEAKSKSMKRRLGTMILAGAIEVSEKTAQEIEQLLEEKPNVKTPEA